MSRLRSIVSNAALVSASLLVGLLLVEIVLRVAQINTLSNIRVVPGQGVTRVPNASYVWKKEGSSRGRFNSHGFRDVERTWETAPGTFRIAVFGDSYTDALQVPQEQTYASVLERELNRRASGVRFEVLNLGQSGFGTTDEYVRWLHFGLRYAPDLVLVAFYPGNDFRNNSSVLNTENLACYFLPDPAGGEPHLDCSRVESYLAARGPVHRSWQWLKRRSYFASLVSERLYLLGRQRADRARTTDASSPPSTGPKALDPFSDLNVYLDDPPRPWRDAIDLTGWVLGKFADDVRTRGERIALVTVSSSEQIDPAVGKLAQEQSSAPLDFDRAERLVTAAAAEHEIPTLNLGPIFRAEYARTGTLLHGSGDHNHGHWNADGHSLAAREIASFLVAQGLVPASAAP